MQVGEISEPFLSTFGWHIIKLEDKRVSDATEEAIRNHAYGLLYKRKFAEEVDLWLSELRAQAFVKINPPQ